MSRFCVAMLLVLCSGVSVGQEDKNAITFEVPVLPRAERYLDILTTPAYAALALENNGLYASVSSRLVVKSREEFQVRNARVKFVDRKGPIFEYEAGAILFSGIGEKSLTFPATVDTREMAQGKIRVRIQTSFAGILPQQLIDRIQFKINSLADLKTQQMLIEYFDRLSSQNGGKRERMLDAIAFEAYNRLGLEPAQRMPKEATSISDLVVLVIIILVWLAGYPIFLLFHRRRARKMAEVG